MSDEIKIELVADADGVIKAVKKIGPEAKKAVKPLNDGLDKANKKSSGLVKTIKKFGPAFGAAAILGSLKKIVTDFANFEQKIAEVNTLLPQTNKVTKETEQAIRRLSGLYGKDAVDLASAYYDVISAGSQDASESLDLLEASTKAAVVGVSDVQTATGAILSVMNAYGKENVSAAEAGQKLFGIVKEGRTTFPELAASIGDIVPVAAQLGIDLDQLGGFLAVSTRISGNTSKSVTQLSAAFNAVLKPTDEAKKVIKLLNKETGAAIDFSATALKEQGLQKFFEGILNATKGFKNQQAILSKVFTSTEALKGVLSVTGENFDKVKQSIDNMSKSQTALDDGFKDIDETLKTKLNRTLAKLTNLLAPLGEGIGAMLGAHLDALNMLLDSIERAGKIITSSRPSSPGGTRDFLGRGAIQPETFSPESAVPFQMGQEGLDPTAAFIDSIVGVTSVEDEENPMMKFAVNTDNISNSIAKLSETSANAELPLDKIKEKVEEGGDKAKDTKDKFDLLKDSMNAAFTGGAVKAVSTGIQTMTRALITGEMNFQAFGKAIAGILGDMAIQMGETALLTGLALDSIGKLTGSAAIVAGLGLIALGNVLKAAAGSGGATSSIPSPTSPVGESASSTLGPLEDTIAEDEPGVIEKQQQVQVVVQGDILDNGEETATRILNILNDNFDSSGARISYA